MKIRTVTLGIGIIVSLAAAAACYWLLRAGDAGLRLQGTLEIQEVRLASKAGGRIAEVLIREGELVHPGQALVLLAAPELEAQREQWLARVQALTAAVQRTRSGARSEEKEAAEAAAGNRSMVDGPVQWLWLQQQLVGHLESRRHLGGRSSRRLRR